MSSDQRVLQPEGVTVCMASRCKSPRYHWPDCEELDKIKNVVDRDIAVAKWKGYEPCSKCFDVDTDENKCILSGVDVDRIRRSLISGASCGELADRYGVGETTISDHAKRRLEFSYDQDPALPPVEWKGTWVFK